MRGILPTVIGLAFGLAAGGSVLVQGMPGDNMIDGERYPNGYTPVAIKDGVYPRRYTPGTELLDPNEMRVVALGTSMPNVITGNQVDGTVGKKSKDFNLEDARSRWHQIYRKDTNVT